MKRNQLRNGKPVHKCNETQLARRGMSRNCRKVGQWEHAWYTKTTAKLVVAHWVFLRDSSAW